MNTVQKLEKQGLITPPKWLPLNVHLLVTMGSIAYGVGTKESDHDMYGFAMPPKDLMFPHLAGHIPGFGKAPPTFEQWEEHHISDTNGKEYDFSVWSIVKYFHQCMGGNPNMIDSLFVPEDCINVATKIGRMVLDNRHMFLSRSMWYRFRGYMYSQKSNMVKEGTDKSARRQELVDKYGYDVKFAYNIPRLLLEAEQLLTTGTLDLRRDRELLKAIRRGEWTQQQILDFANEKLPYLEKLYEQSTLPDYPDQEAIKGLLINCIEEQYGTISTALEIPSRHKEMIDQIREIVR